MCSSCGFGLKTERCVRCDGFFASAQAKLCASCGSGGGCVKCGGMFASVEARLCMSCGFGARASACIKCGSQG